MKDTGKGFIAIMKDISLFDYIQLIQITNKTKTLEITCKGKKKEKAVLQFIKGKIEFAKTSNFIGKEAFFHILTWEEGVLKEIDFGKKLKKNITDKSNLLLEAAEYIDKLNLEKAKNKEKELELELELELEENKRQQEKILKENMQKEKLRDKRSEVFKVQL